MERQNDLEDVREVGHYDFGVAWEYAIGKHNGEGAVLENVCIRLFCQSKESEISIQSAPFPYPKKNRAYGVKG
jgi:hypothetical protein